MAIVVSANGLAAGTVLGGGVTLREHVPQGHKVSLTDLEAGAPIRRYGVVIGVAARAVAAGSWIAESLVQLPAAPPLDSLPITPRRVPPPEPLPGYTFEGYRNADGSVGTRNLLAISTSVQCVAGVMEHAVRRIRQDLLPRFPNVDGVVALTHTYGCGVAINAPGAAIRSARCATWRAIRISGARRWWSAWAARNCGRNGCCRVVARALAPRASAARALAARVSVVPASMARAPAGRSPIAAASSSSRTRRTTVSAR